MSTTITQYFCRTCQRAFRGRNCKGGRTFCGPCMKGKPDGTAEAVVDLFDALKRSLETPKRRVKK